MIFQETDIKGAFVIDLERREDERGFFARAWCQKEFRANNLNPGLVQANCSYSKKKGTLRGMHYQLPPHEEAKLVRCTHGAIYDVVIDLRKASPTFRQWAGVELSAENRRMIYVPEGCAHGFLTLEDDSEVFYLVSTFYTPGAEKGVRWNDPILEIRWPMEVSVISDKDKGWPDYVC